MTDITRAETFLATHARLLERRRLELLLRRAGAVDGVLSALAAYRNPDGGYGYGLEPDLRAAGSQPAGAFQALTVLAELAEQAPEAAPAAGELTGRLCDWLDTIALDGGALPFSLAGADGPGTAPWWAGGDPTEPSLHITAGIGAYAQRVRAQAPALADHPWLTRATDWCLEQVAAGQRPEGGGYTLAFVLGLLDAVVDVRPSATAELERMAAFVPESGALPVSGGTDSEVLRPLRISPEPGRPLRALMPAEAIARDLAALAGEQEEDGGWTVDFPSSSPAGALEWRGIATIEAITLLRAG
ncbi:MAG TPA: hypothetical protein VLK58_28065 [Conexibacter sp.]|nr:hypothetical protein [Conexibacter sp.]